MLYSALDCTALYRKVVRDGHADMAVSNAIGSNVFEILVRSSSALLHGGSALTLQVCLGVPWLLQTAWVQPDGQLIVQHKVVI